MQYVDVLDLRHGMFVQLELSWMEHPFATSNFLLSSDAQIDTIRALGLKAVRWDPSRSVFNATPQTAAVGAQAGTALPPAQPVHCVADASEEGNAAVKAGKTAEPTAVLRTTDAPRQCHASLRAASLRCERSYAEAYRQWRTTIDLLRTGVPTDAGNQAKLLCSKLLEQMLRDPETSLRSLSEVAVDRGAGHALNVTVLSLLLGRVLNLPEVELLALGQGALLHDIGKIDLPDRVRHLQEHFTAAEVKLYREHVALGVAQGRRMGLDAAALLLIAQHHELADASGFPQGVHLSKLSQGARIVALVNRYDNLCNPPLAALALTPHEALSLLFAQGQSKYDPRLLGAFVRMMGVYPPGSVVQLTDERYALVTSVNAGRPLKPRVLVHDARVPYEEAPVLDLEREPGLGIRRSLKPAQLPREALQYLSPNQRISYFFDVGPAALAQEPAA
jgi:putative nucleotidyltransferase with HDIG domain